MSSNKSGATAIVGTWVALPKDCNRGSNIIFPNPSRKDTLRTAAILLSCKSNSSQPETSSSAIGQHLLQNPPCAQKYTEGKFSILDPPPPLTQFFIYPPIKPLTCQIYANKKNSFTASNTHANCSLSIGFFSDQSFSSALIFFSFLRIRYKSFRTTIFLYSKLFF